MVGRRRWYRDCRLDGGLEGWCGFVFVALCEPPALLLGMRRMADPEGWRR